MNPLEFENNQGSRNYWFYLYPYVYVSVKKDRAILYNTLNYRMLEYRCGTSIYKLVKRLDADSNLYVIKIKASEIDEGTGEFINQIRDLYFGDVIDTALSTQKPIQLKPILNLEKTLDELAIGDEKTRVLVHDEIPDYLNIITLYINSRCNQSCSICPTAYKQFSCCCKRNGDEKRLDKEDIATLITQVRTGNLHKFNIIGGNLFHYPMLEELVMDLNASRIIKDYHFHYLNIEDRPAFFTLMRDNGNQVTVTVHFPVPLDGFAAKMEVLEKYQIVGQSNFQFVVQNEKDIELSEVLISKSRIENYQLVPYFNGDNLDFFREAVFLDRDSILESQPQMNDILERTVLNRSDFKKLGVLSDKSVHANLNNPKIGTLGNEHIMEIIYKELHKGKSWTKVRKRVKPCKSCAFNALCPPISNYEYAIGRYNLCNINT